MDILFRLILISSFLILGSVGAGSAGTMSVRTGTAPTQEEEQRENSETSHNGSQLTQNRQRVGYSAAPQLNTHSCSSYYVQSQIPRIPPLGTARHSLPNGLPAPMLC